jgi:peptide/nickel transport system ATP-binding protein/oligopeptide transport system ATP-binding protein
MTGHAPLLSVRGLYREFATARRGLRGRRGAVRAVDGVSFDILPGETLGLVGESGCGKSTTGRLVLRILEPTAGTVAFDGRDLLALSPRDLRAVRRDMQIVFQDPQSALNPRMTVGEQIVEPLVIHGIGDALSREERLRALLGLVGLAEHHASRFPHEFSGGQKQRVCIARALALNPRFIVCDEAASALDVSIQAQILNLLQDLKRQLGLTYLFISHDLGVIRHISDRVAVMYLGQIVEIGPKAAIFDAPLHPYTMALLASVPSSRDGKQHFATIHGDVPNPADPPPGCRFHTRCPFVQAICRTTAPALRSLGASHDVACHFAEDIRTRTLTERSPDAG